MQGVELKMNELIQRFAEESVWYAEYHPRIQRIEVPWQPWLLHRGSLTERLIEFSSNKFEVKVRSQRWGKPLMHEAVQLSISPHLVARIREVELHCDGKAVVYARSVMPLEMYLEQRHTLQSLGAQPLGQLLFRDGRIRSSKRRISVYDNPGKPSIYGRSTPYRYFGNEILVSEFFINRRLID
jgi:chorismate--pyruvate lyase